MSDLIAVFEHALSTSYHPKGSWWLRQSETVKPFIAVKCPNCARSFPIAGHIREDGLIMDGPLPEAQPQVITCENCSWHDLIRLAGWGGKDKPKGFENSQPAR